MSSYYGPAIGRIRHFLITWNANTGRFNISMSSFFALSYPNLLELPILEMNSLLVRYMGFSCVNVRKPLAFSKRSFSY